MGALFFTIKTFILTAVLIALLQIRWSGETLESRLSKTAAETGLLQVADTIADGAIRLSIDTWNSLIAAAEDQKNNLVNSAEFDFNQSEAYMSKNSDSAKRAIRKFRMDLQKKFEKTSEDSTEIQVENLESEESF